MKTAEFFASRAAEGDIRTALDILHRDGGQPPEPHDRKDFCDVR